jgi:DNA-binding MarR family transcriptional regulator
MLFEGHKYLTGVEIAGMLEVAKSRATVIIENLEKRGLVQRSADPNDARVKLISLTPAGQRKVREIEEFMFDLHQQLLGQIDPDQRAGVIAALETLRSSMEAVKAQFSK